MNTKTTIMKIKIVTFQDCVQNTKYRLSNVFYKGSYIGEICTYGNRISQYRLNNSFLSEAALFGSVNAIVKQTFI